MLKKSFIVSVLFFMIGCDEKTDTPFSIDYEKYELDNGLTVILHEDKSDPIVSMAIQYHVGSNREIPGRTGFAHLFEHMLFQESQHVGQDQFFKKIQNVGGTLNGGTNKDGTVYYEVVPKNALETIMWLESDRMGWLLSTVTQAAFENQQEVVQNEKRQRVDNRPYGHSNYVMIKNMYPKDHPYNWTTIGELEDLQNSTLKDVRDFYENWYGPNNATMVIAGDINKKEVKKLVDKYFAEIKPGPDHGNPEPRPVQLSETKGGNKSLPIGCQFCAHKWECYKDANDGKGLRVFKYSNRYVYLAQVNRQPNVEEITKNFSEELKTYGKRKVV